MPPSPQHPPSPDNQALLSDKITKQYTHACGGTMGKTMPGIPHPPRSTLKPITKLYQPTNHQSINQSINQPTNQSTNQLMNNPRTIVAAHIFYKSSTSNSRSAPSFCRSRQPAIISNLSKYPLPSCASHRQTRGVVPACRGHTSPQTSAGHVAGRR